MKRPKRTPPEESLALDSIAGEICALQELKEHYDRLMRYALNMEIQKATEDFGFEEKMYGFEDLLGDMRLVFDNAVMDFEIIED